jgi:hypothetical protein
MIAETYTGTDPEKGAAIQATAELNGGIWDASRDNPSGLESKMIVALQCVVKNGVPHSFWEAAPHPKSQSISWCVNLMRISYAVQLWCLEHPQTRNLSNKHR